MKDLDLSAALTTLTMAIEEAIKVPANIKPMAIYGKTREGKSHLSELICKQNENAQHIDCVALADEAGKKVKVSDQIDSTKSIFLIDEITLTEMLDLEYISNQLVENGKLVIFLSQSEKDLSMHYVSLGVIFHISEGRLYF